MAASMPELPESFEGWLSGHLQTLNPLVDLEVFVSYIQGILDTDDTDDDKQESLEGILSSLIEENIENESKKIINQWNVSNKDRIQEKQAALDKEKEEQDALLANIMQKQQISVTKGKELTKEEKAQKAAILAQYAQVSEGEEEDEPDKEETADKTEAGALPRNLNMAMVDQLQKNQREQLKAAHDHKKQKDKEDREKQKAKAQDRKDAEKKRTQKGERRR